MSEVKVGQVWKCKGTGNHYEVVAEIPCKWDSRFRVELKKGSDRHTSFLTHEHLLLKYYDLLPLHSVAQTVPTPTGQKHDGDKARYDLIPFHALEDVVSVLTYGARKYAPDNWKTVKDAKRRYLAAALRHLTAYARGEMNDPETGKPHLAHAVCCLMFLSEGQREKTDE